MADAHLNGSLNLPSAEDVFRTVAAIADDSITKIPDGETDERRGWIAALVPRLQQATHPALSRPRAPQGRRRGHAAADRHRQAPLSAGVRRRDRVRDGPQAA
jgi:hypothetical protein